MDGRRAVVQMPESSLSSLRRSPILNDLNDLRQVLEAAIKYDMSGIAGRVMVLQVRKRSPGMPQNAYQCSLDSTISELEHVPAVALHFLEGYHSKCGRAVSAVSKNFLWIDRNQLVQFYCIPLAC